MKKKRTKTMTLNLSVDEMETLNALAVRCDTSKTTIMKRALALFRLINEEAAKGHSIFTMDKNKKRHEIIVL